MTIVYNILFCLFGMFYIPYALIKGKWHEGFKKRLGKFSENEIKRFSERNNIWIHAVSVGEVLAVTRLIDEIRKVYPNHRIVCSTVTQTGYKIACQRLAKDDIVIYAPLDLSWIVKKYIRSINPLIYISAETEIWPNVYTQLHKVHIPIMIVNGRISDKGYQGYRKVSFLTKKILRMVKVFCMQSELDRERIINLGASRERTINVGNIKFDVLDNQGHFLLSDFGYQEDDQLFVAGSTHKGEESIVVEIFKKLSKTHAELRLVIVPRHIERADEVCGQVLKAGFQAVKFSQRNNNFLNQDDVLVVDEIGKLQSFYKVSHCVFIGKSLVDGGGQNMIEPAFYGKPVWVGPHIQNFKDIINIFLKENALVQVDNAEQLYLSMDSFLNNPERLKQLGMAAKKVVEDNRGATLRTVEEIKKAIRV